MKYDKMKNGKLIVGDPVFDDIELHDLQRKKFSLKEVINPNKISIIVAGSYS
jgi:hypothetical protein